MENNPTEENMTESESSPAWAELTHECLTDILSRLTLEQRWRGPMFACKSWMRAAQDSSLYSALDLEPRFNSETESPSWWTAEFERRIDSMIRSVVAWSDGGLSEIRIRHCSDRSLDFVVERCPNLEVLSIKSSPNVANKSMARIALNCPNLRELDISYCYDISSEYLILIGTHCPNIKILKRNFLNTLDPSQHMGVIPSEYLNACPQDGDSDAEAIANFMPNLEHLELGFSKLSARGLHKICEGCTNLKYLDLFGCVNLTSRDVVNATSNRENLEVRKPNFYIPRSVFHSERYGHWRLYDERFQTDVFRI